MGLMDKFLMISLGFNAGVMWALWINSHFKQKSYLFCMIIIIVSIGFVLYGSNK